jgi:DNA-binding transcriptional LysR family regulator
VSIRPHCPCGEVSRLKISKCLPWQYRLANAETIFWPIKDLCTKKFPGWESRFSAPVQAGPGAHPSSCTMGTGSFPWVKSGRGVTLIPHPLVVPWSWKGRAIPLLPLWSVRPVQSLGACTRVHFTFTFTSYMVLRHEISNVRYGPAAAVAWSSMSFQVKLHRRMQLSIYKKH